MKTEFLSKYYSTQIGFLLVMILSGCAESETDQSALSTTPILMNSLPENALLLASTDQDELSQNKSQAESSSSSDTSQNVVTLKNVIPEDLSEGEDWPYFLGPNHTGVSGEKGFAEKWPEDGPPVLWEKKTGSGYSSPAIVGNQLIVFHRHGGDEIVESIHPANGKPQWSYKYSTQYRDPYGYNNGPRCSPIVGNGFCYTFGAEGKIHCLDMKTGDKIWMRDIQKDFDIPQWFFGVGCTPILENDKLFVLVGGQPNSGVVAFDAKTGKTLWQNGGRDVWDGVKTDNPGEKKYQWTGEEMVVSYVSPILATIHGKRHLLCILRHGFVSFDPETGQINFKYWFRSRTHESVNASGPVVVGNQIFISSAYKVGSALLNINKDGKGYDVVWRNKRNMEAHWSTPIHVDGYIYGFSGRHEHMSDLRCLDLKTGEVKWTTNGFEGDLSEVRQDRATGKLTHSKTGKPVYFYGRGSKIKVEDKFIVFGERGLLTLVKINSGKYEEISRATYKQIHYPSWPAPVLSRKRLYLRCEEMLLCLDLASK
jgi:outer membrane protein assembly factor BamB